MGKGHVPAQPEAKIRRFPVKFAVLRECGRRPRRGRPRDNRNVADEGAGSHCHGPNMMNSGTITPDLRAFPDDRTRFVTTVKEGKNNKMPPWADILSEQEITDLWAFVASRRKP